MAQVIIGAAGPSQVTTYTMAGSYQHQKNVGELSTATFDVLDSTGQWAFQKGQPIQVINPTDTTELFEGFVNDVSFIKYGSQGGRLHSFTVGGNEYLVQKRIVASTYTDEFTGDILSDLVLNYFADEGVNGRHAIRTETTQADWSGGAFGWSDNFATNSVFAYTQGGATSTNTWSVNKLQITNGAGAFSYLTRQGFATIKDGTITATMTQCQSGFLLLRYTDSNNWYGLRLSDDSGANPTANLQAQKAVAGTVSSVGTAANITWTRGTSHTILFSVVGSNITASFDGVSAVSTTDSSITASGYMGIGHNGSSTASIFTSLITSHQQLATTAQGDGAMQLAPLATDYSETDTTQADWNTWTLSSLSSSRTVNSLQINGYSRNWDDNLVTSQTLFGATGDSQSASAGAFWLGAGSGTDARSRLDAAGSFTNFTCDFDFEVPTGGNIGIVYRTTAWNNNNDTYAYNACYDKGSGQVRFAHGSNSGTGVFTSITTATLNLSAGTTHHMQVLVNGTSHKITIDGTLYINSTDSTYTASGQVGLRVYNTSPVFFDNFGIVPFTSTITGTAQKDFNPSAIGTAQGSAITWDVSTPSGNTTLVQAAISTNSGSTFGSFSTCTSGAAIPGITSGMALATVRVRILVTLTSNIASATPDFQDITLTITAGTYSAGFRISAPLDVSAVQVARQATVSWTTSTPASTTAVVDLSYDNGLTWQTLTNGQTLPGINIQSSSTLDAFNSDTSAEYSRVFCSGGNLGSWSTDLVNDRLVNIGGDHSIQAWGTSLGSPDMTAQADVYQGNTIGVVCRYTNTSNFYRAQAFDSTASAANTLQIKKRVADTETVLATVSISFTTQTFHRIAFTVQGTTLTAYWDNVQVAQVTDSGLTTGSMAGLYASGGGTSIFYMFSAQPIGTNLTGMSVTLRETLTTSVQGNNPIFLDLTIAVRTWYIQDGPTVSSTVFGWQPGDVCIQALADAAGFWWHIDDSLHCIFQAKNTTPAPWTATGTDMILESIIVENNNPLYRNRQFVVNGVALTNQQIDIRQGDGNSNAFTLAYNVAQVPLVETNIGGAGYVAQTVGIKGIDDLNHNDSWYWNKGDNTITQDSLGTLLTTADFIRVTYVGQYASVAISENLTEVSNRQLIEGGSTSGFVDNVISSDQASGTDAMLDMANGLLAAYGSIGRTITFQTKRSGLDVGQLLYIYLPDLDLNYTETLIGSIQPTEIGPTLYWTVTCYEGPVIGTWTQIFNRLTQQTPLLVDSINIGSAGVITSLKSFSESLSWAESVPAPTVTTGQAPSTTLYPATSGFYPL